MMKNVKFVGICVRDQDRALAFWTDKIGLAITTDQPMGPGQRWIELKIPGAETGIVLFTPPGLESHIGTFHNMSFRVDNVDRTYTEWREKGVEFIQAPKKESWGTSAIFKDPDGNTFVISA
jgi:predicted enzyme related to lactoylglutathione lyase